MLADVNPNSKCAEGMDFLAQLFTGRAPQPKAKANLLAKFIPAKAKK
jgi:hypothetical protein